jgi:hypothetical protein
LVPTFSIHIKVDMPVTYDIQKPTTNAFTATGDAGARKLFFALLI